MLYKRGVGMVDLNSLIDPSSGWVLLQAIGINDSGQIVGQGQFDGQTRAFLLTPVPEPKHLVLAAVACCVILFAGRCRIGASKTAG
jgi:hypothetical protein